MTTTVSAGTGQKACVTAVHHVTSGKGHVVKQGWTHSFFSSFLESRCSDLPRISHHEVEVGIRVNGGTYARIVVDELFNCHLAVGVIGAVKVLQE